MRLNVPASAAREGTVACQIAEKLGEMWIEKQKENCCNTCILSSPAVSLENGYYYSSGTVVAL